FEHRLVVVASHETFERGECARREHPQVGELTGGERNRLERLEIGRAPARAIDEFAAVRLDELQVGRCDRHAITAPNNPFSSRKPRMRSALASADSRSE